MRRSVVALSALLVGLTAGTAACGSHPGASRRTSETRSEAAFRAPSRADVQRLIDRFLAGHDVGVQVAVSHDGRVVLSAGYGSADLAARTPVDADTRFAIGSVTKQVTAALVLQLVHDGRLSLSTPLSDLVPEVHWPAGLDVEELLHQTSGLGDDLPGLPIVRQGPVAVDRYIAAQPMHATPGTTYEYDNANYIVLGTLVQRLAGTDYLDAADDLWPTRDGVRCGRGEATAYDAHSLPPRAVTTYPVAVSGAAGGLCATATSLLSWQQALVSGSLGGDLWQQMTTVAAHSGDYGMGIYVDPDLDWHDGVLPSKQDPAGGETAYLAWLPHEHVGVAVLANTVGGGSGDARHLGEALAHSLMTPVAPAGG